MVESPIEFYLIVFYGPSSSKQPADSWNVKKQKQKMDQEVSADWRK